MIRHPDEVLSVLKDFQRDTVEYVFRRLYLDEPHTRRFLVADEVGLGKTLVARGVIAKTLHHLERQEEVDRLDVVYVCSNGAIAQQNINRLNVTGLENVALPTRLSLLPLHVKKLEANAVNFISLTPGTSFDTKSRGGAARERVLLWAILRPDLPPWLQDGLANALQGTVQPENWPRYLREFDGEIDWDLQRRFLEALFEDQDVYERLKEVCARFHAYRPRDRTPWEDRDLALQLVSDLRGLMARVCVDALEPDLIILDEFQRFRDLLTGEGDAAELTRAFLNYREPSGHHARTLLLSATPYRMMSLHHEAENHYEDFLQTCGFLFDEDGEEEVTRLEEDLGRYRRALFAARQGGSGDAVRTARAAVEGRLRKVMVRTERVPESRNRGAMVATSERTARVRPVDLAQVRLTDRVARILDAQDVIEYWKSAPYLLSLMGGYQIKKRFRDEAEVGSPELQAAVAEADGALLRNEWFEAYREIDPANARLRRLLADTVEAGLWKLLWMPPSRPYLSPSGVYADIASEATKALVFSTWSVVPDAIAALCSYEAERRVLAEDGRPVAYSRLNESVSSPLRFVITREGRYSGQYNLLPFYPSPTLAALGDPLSLGREGETLPLDPDEARGRVAERIRARLAELEEETPSVRDDYPELGEDQSWYWRRLAHLDRDLGVADWAGLRSGWEAVSGEGEGLKEHIRYFAAAFVGEEEPPSGPPPDDMVDVLVDLALGSPAVCALRALHRLVPEVPLDDRRLLRAAAHAAQGFRTLFDLAETFLLLRSQDNQRYWQRILRYGIEGNLQAVLDEYAHVLKESTGLMDHDPEKVLKDVSGAMHDVLSIRTSRISADDIQVDDDGAGLRLEGFNIRTRFVLRFGDLRDENENTLHRADVVRLAFNSPFRPFVLASTSVGQEGLDFHLYCHALYHWNLPSNPVDLEQREGRIHRYKSHAVRKNIAHTFGAELGRAHHGHGDPWAWMFARALEERPPDVNDLVPFWIFEEGPARVERRVPMIPLTREVAKLKRLVRSLAVYRMAFGQPRQEDLLAYLEEGMEGEGDGDGDGIPEGWQISLRPPPGTWEAGESVASADLLAGPPLAVALDELRQGAESSGRLGYLDIWTRFFQELATHVLPVELPAPNSMNQVRIDFARSRAAIGYSFKHDRLRLFWLTRADRDPVGLYRWLMANREEIDRELGVVGEWSTPDGEGNGHIMMDFDYDPRDEASVKKGVAEVVGVLGVMGKWVG